MAPRIKAAVLGICMLYQFGLSVPVSNNPPSACSKSSKAVHIDKIIEVGENDSGSLCNLAAATCRSYAHFIWIVRTDSALTPVSTGAFISVNEGPWSPAPSSATIFQAHTLPPTGPTPLGNTSMVFSTQFDATFPVASDGSSGLGSSPPIRSVRVSPWVKIISNDTTPRCGQLFDFPTKNLAAPVYTPSTAAMSPTFKFGNWSLACVDRHCRLMGHMALNANPLHAVTPVTVATEITWAASMEEVQSDGWTPTCGQRALTRPS